MTERFSKETFQAWRDHPLTAHLRKFLKDNQQALGDRWMAGEHLDRDQQIKALLMGELADLRWESVAEFYGIPVDELPRDDGADT